MNRSSSCHTIVSLLTAVVAIASLPVCSEAISFQHKFATDAYDGVGNVTNRLFTSGKSQALVWDGLGRLVRLTQRENPTNGFNWTAAYDALGRRVRTTQTPVVNGVTNSAETLTLDSYFDPEVEFLELAVGVNGARTWKVLGLDGDEDYGGMQGVGGLEATIRESDGLITPVLNDYAGNVLATVSGGAANWNPVRVSGYGPVNGYQAATLSPGVPLAETLVWRTRRVDPSGFFYLGARYYDGTSGRFLSPDPLGHAASMDLYSFADGDPLNNFDADGRFVSGGLNGAGQWASQTYANWGNGLDAMLRPITMIGARLGMGSQASAELNYNGGYQADFSYQRNFDQGSAAFQMGHYAGYAAAEIGFQVALVAATEGFGTLARGAALGSSGGLGWGMGGGAARMGGTMAFAEEAATAARAPIVSLQGPTMTSSSGSGQGLRMNWNSPATETRVPQLQQQQMVGPVTQNALPAGGGGTGEAYNKAIGQGLYILRDQSGAIKYIGRGDAPQRLYVHARTEGMKRLQAEIIWQNNLTKAQAKGLEQRLIDHFGGAKRWNQNSPLINDIRSFSPENPNALKYRNAVTDELWNATLKRLGL